MQSVAMKMDKMPGSASAFMAFTSDQSTSSVLMEAAGQCGFDETSVVPVHQGLDEILATLITMSTPKILIVDMADSEDLMADVNALANACDPDCHVIIIGHVNDVNIYRTMMDQGVQEYLVKPVSLDRVADAFKRIQRGTASNDTSKAAVPEKKMQRIAFVEVHGGSGASTIAANFAWGLSTEHKQRVSLIDLDLTFGTLALQMDTEPGKGLADALVTPSRVDELFLKRALTPYTENLHLLASEADPGTMIDVSANAIDVLFEHMRDGYDSCVLDLPRDVLIRQPVFLNILDEIILVAEPSLVGLRDATRIARMIRERQPETPVWVVLNRIGLSPDADLATEVFTKNSGLEVIGEVPFDAKASALAAAKGQVMIEADKRSKIAIALNAFTEKLLPGDAEESSPKPFWARLMQRG